MVWADIAMQSIGRIRPKEVSQRCRHGIVGAWMLLAAGALAAAGGCDASVSLPGGEGQPCQSDGDCGGLTCMDYGVPADGGCISYGRQCVQTCNATTDCSSAGTGFGCYAACGGTSVCQPPPPGIDGGTDAGPSVRSDAGSDASKDAGGNPASDAGPEKG